MPRALRWFENHTTLNKVAGQGAKDWRNNLNIFLCAPGVSSIDLRSGSARSSFLDSFG